MLNSSVFLWIEQRASASSRERTSFLLAERDNFITIQNEAETTKVLLKKREVYPKTYAILMEDGSVRCGYGSLSPRQDDEYLHVTCQLNGHMYIERDTCAALPLFFCQYDGGLLVSDNYSEIAHTLPKLTLNPFDIVRALSPYPLQLPTMWQEIGVLNGNEALSFSPGHKPRKSVLRQREVCLNDALTPSDPREFFERLEARFERTLQQYGVFNDSQQPPGFEVSGGLDSPTLPLYVAEKYPQEVWHATSFFYMQFESVTQARKLEDVIRLAPSGQFHFFTFDKKIAEGHRFYAPNATHMVYPYCSPLTFRDVFSERLVMHGVKVLLTGNGGDELFEHFVSKDGLLGVGDEIIKWRLDSSSSFFTEKFATLVRACAELPPPTLPLIGSSLIGMNILYNTYIENDIWPASPFIDAEFYAYCQALPWKYRYNKQILRTYYEAKGFPARLHGDIYPNEYPDQLSRVAMTTDGMAKIVEWYANNSWLAYMGFVDVDELLKEYTILLRTDASGSNFPFHLNLFLTFERNLHVAYNSGQWKPVF